MRNRNSGNDVSPTPTPAAQTNQTSPPASQENRPTREHRAQAYAKLLEGQRYLIAVRRSGNYESPLLNDARAAFTEAVRLDPTLAEAHTALSEIYFTAGELDLAEAEAKRSVTTNRDNFGAHRLLSRIYSLRSGLRESNINRATIDLAVAELREVVRLLPSDAEAWALLGEFYLVTDREREAIEAFTRWAAASPTLETLFYAHITQGRELSPGTAVTRLGEVLLLRGRTTEAVATFRRAVALGADNPAADIALIDLLRSQGQRQEALAATQSARRRFPEEMPLVRIEVLLLAELNRVDEGAALLRGRLTGDALGDFEEYRWLANIYLQAGRGRESTDAARRALEIASTLGRDIAPRAMNQALIMLASGQQRTGDTGGAEESLRRVLTTEPNNAMALNNLGYFLVERNERLNEAVGLIERAVRIAPNNSSYLDSLGWAYFKLGRLEEAERYLTEAARRNPTSMTNQEHLGDLYFRQGKHDEARAAWRRALALSIQTTETARLRAKLNAEQAQ